jgi:eukaryotic-like serine/threonine-protein kinase
MVDEPALNLSLSRYRVISKIGAGGMGEVYLAEDARLGRQVALKVLAADVADDGERFARFEQEAKAASALNHPNILTVYEFGEEDGVHYLASELVRGRTVRDLIESNELELGLAIKIAEQTAFALDAAHSSGIVHRDIKPAVS